MSSEIAGAYPGLRFLEHIPGPDYLRIGEMIQATDEPFAGAKTSYRKYIIATPAPIKPPYGPLRAGGREWPNFGFWEGWYWAEEIELARRLGYDCLGFEGIRFRTWLSFEEFEMFEASPEYDGLVAMFYAASAQLALYRERYGLERVNV